jgi:glutamate/tyrosine decarboxylase-like PLP-dependent enzyme
MLQQAGFDGYRKMIGKDIRLARLLYNKVNDHPDLEAISQNLSITVFRYVPADLPDVEDRQALLNRLNEDLLNDLQQGGEVFLSNAVVNGNYCLRACFVNFRTSEKDVEEIVQIIEREGKIVLSKLYSEKH